LGLDVVTSEDGASWLTFLRGLKARGLRDVRLVISDSHAGLKDAIATVLTGASWQRCRTHFMRNLLTRVPKSAQDFVAALVRSIFAQPDHGAVMAQHARVVEQLHERFPEASAMLADAASDILAFATFPKEHWRQIWSNNPQERLNREIRRRTDVVGIFPNRNAVVRLVGAVLAEQHDEWQVARRYMSIESLAKARFAVIDGDQEVEEQAVWVALEDTGKLVRVGLVAATLWGNERVALRPQKGPGRAQAQGVRKAAQSRRQRRRRPSLIRVLHDQDDLRRTRRNRGASDARCLDPHARWPQVRDFIMAATVDRLVE